VDDGADEEESGFQSYEELVVESEIVLGIMQGT
jgi:hypothetical protein